MNAYEAYERLRTINEYIAALSKSHSKLSNWNEEFGEGNPDAVSIELLIKELGEEKDGLITAMESTLLLE